jgi:Fe-S cluster biogenesis protein NfuA
MLHLSGGRDACYQFNSLPGACSHCSISDVTLTRYIQEELQQAFPEISEVVAV